MLCGHFNRVRLREPFLIGESNCKPPPWLYRCNYDGADTSNVLDLNSLGAERHLRTLLGVLLAMLAFAVAACTPARRQMMAHLPATVEMADPCPGEGGMPRFNDQEPVLMISNLRPTGTACKK